MQLNKYLILVAILLFGAFLFYNNKKNIPPTPFVDKNGYVTDDVVRILGWTGIRIENDSLSAEKEWPDAKIILTSRSLEDVTNAIQGKINPEFSWRAAPHVERWQVKPSFALSPLALKAIKEIAFKNLQIAQEINPQKTAYNGVLFLGATLGRVRARLAYLNHLIEQEKYTFKPVYILTGERDLDEAVGEKKEALLNADNHIISFNPSWVQPIELPQNETEMVKWVFGQSKHPSLKEEDIIIVHTLKNQQKRATTETTVYEWLNLCNPKAGLYLAISNQPYVLYQFLVIQNALLKAGRKDIQVEVVGPAANLKPPTQDSQQEEKRVAELLDNLAHILYELGRLKSLQNERA